MGKMTQLQIVPIVIKKRFSFVAVVLSLLITPALIQVSLTCSHAFWRMSKSIDHVQIKNYMIISAYGMMLMFTSNQPTGLIQAPYPPFGLVTAAFFGLAAFLFLIGVYSSAISVSQDRNIRKYIKNYAKQLTFLGGIGSSEMEKEIQTIVKNVMTEVEAKTRTLESTTGIESSLQEQDIKEYVKIAIQEARRKQADHK